MSLNELRIAKSFISRAERDGPEPTEIGNVTILIYELAHDNLHNKRRNQVRGTELNSHEKKILEHETSPFKII